MGTEIERKFLVRNDGWRAGATSSQRYRQGYLTEPGPASVRVRTMGDQAMLTVKSGTHAIRRAEYEYPIPYADAVEMLESVVVGAVIEKTRHMVPFGRHTWEIDVFEGDNTGLVVAEVELDAVDEEFGKPDWLGREVSGDPAYYNVSLTRRPYCAWDK